jgi:hypothetical protein
MNDNLIYLDTYVLQQDMRIRMPKCILENLGVEKGKTRFAIFLDREDNSLILKINDLEDKRSYAKKK